LPAGCHRIAWHLPAAEQVLETLRRDAPADLAVANLLAPVLVDENDPAERSRGLQLAGVNARY
jgi:hypothetical protein